MKYKGTVDCFKTIAKEEGASAFFAGFSCYDDVICLTLLVGLTTYHLITNYHDISHNLPCQLDRLQARAIRVFCGQAVTFMVYEVGYLMRDGRL